jgi:hypothetical protein
MKNESNEVVSLNPLTATGIEKMILVIRDKQVLLDRDLATLYEVETKRINEQVKRNIERFPEEFCFQLNLEEASRSSKSQVATLNVSGNKRGFNVKKLPYAFTEQGVAMLSAVLHSEKAIKVSIGIMKAFVAMRHFMMQHGGFVNRLSNVEAKIINQDERMLAQDKKMLEHDQKLDELFEAMDRGELQSKGLFYNNQVFDAYVFVCGLIQATLGIIPSPGAEVKIQGYTFRVLRMDGTRMEKVMMILPAGVKGPKTQSLHKV